MFKLSRTCEFLAFFQVLGFARYRNEKTRATSVCPGFSLSVPWYVRKIQFKAVFVASKKLFTER